MHKFCLIYLPILSLPSSWSTCCSSFERRVASLGSICAPSVYYVAIIYASLSLRSLFFGPGLFLTSGIIITSLTLFLVVLSTPIRYHRCFREEHLSGEDIKFGALYRVDFGNQNSSRSSIMIDLVNIPRSTDIPINVYLSMNQWKT